MLNKNLFDDPKDAEIARLKMLIERFKKYDKERTEYYAKKMQKLGELETFMQEIECAKKSSEPEIIIAKQKTEIRRLNQTIKVNAIVERVSEEEVAKRIIDYDRIKEGYKRLKKENKNLKKAISELAGKK